MGRGMTLAQLPFAVPLLQQQQHRMAYLCPVKDLAMHDMFFPLLKRVHKVGVSVYVCSDNVSQTSGLVDTLLTLLDSVGCRCT